MELNAEQIKKALECCQFRHIKKNCDECKYHRWIEPACRDLICQDALALVTSQEQRIKELTEELAKCYTENAKLTEENAYIKHIELEAMRSSANSYKMHNEKLTVENEKIGIDNFNLICELSRIKEETVRKMQERLNEVVENSGNRVYTGSHIHLFLDQIAKELLEVHNAGE